MTVDQAQALVKMVAEADEAALANSMVPFSTILLALAVLAHYRETGKGEG